MSRYDNYRSGRESRQNSAGWMFLVVIVGFGLYLAWDSGWLSMGIVKSLIPSPPAMYAPVPGAPPVVENAVQVVPNNGRPLSFVDQAGNPIVGMPIHMWVNGQDFVASTNEYGQVTVYTEGFDANDPSSWIVWSGGSGMINGRTVIIID